MELILASSSPRRQQLLSQAGYTFRVEVADVEEAHDASLTCRQLTEANALLKARAVAQSHPLAWVIGADTLVYLDDLPLGKPRDMAEARDMLRALSGKKHAVCTGVALICGTEEQSFSVITEVKFRQLDDATIAAYHATVPVLDKAGGYAIQDHGDMIIESIAGSMTNVVGLPVDELCARLSLLS
jgi:septum formation protein